MLKEFFPIFTHLPHLIYLDSAATSLKPKTVIDKITEYNEYYSSNVHRGLYPISDRATKEYEESRELIADFIHSRSSKNIIFTKNATSAFNLIAYGLLSNSTNKHIVTTIIEHHSNFVPWQQLSIRFRHTFSVIDCNMDGELINIEEIIKPTTYLVSLTHVSNVFGQKQNIETLIQKIKAIAPGCIIILDICQSFAHCSIDAEKLNVDALVWSAHKTYGPTGLGIVYLSDKLLNVLMPFEYGGSMIEEVNLETTTFAKSPQKFEAGTPPIAEVIAYGEAIRFMQNMNQTMLQEKAKELSNYLYICLNKLNNIKIIGTPQKLNTVSFYHENAHAHDIAQLLGDQGICIRAGHHCAQPLHTKLGLSASCRASIGAYNTKSDIDEFIEKLIQVIKILT